MLKSSHDFFQPTRHRTFGMKKHLSIALTTTLVAFSLSASAARPASITFESNGTTADGVEYANFSVKCSNGEKQILTAWDNRKKWCVGSDPLENCDQKQIKTAKKACKD